MMEKARYVDKKNLKLNAEKTKIIKFRKGGGRERREQWECKEDYVEQVKDFKYIRYMFQKTTKMESISRRERRKQRIS